MKLKNLSKVMLGLAVLSLAACSDDNTPSGIGELTPEESAFGKANDVFTAEEWYLAVSWERRRRQATLPSHLPLKPWRKTSTRVKTSSSISTLSM